MKVNTYHLRNISLSKIYASTQCMHVCTYPLRCGAYLYNLKNCDVFDCNTDLDIFKANPTALSSYLSSIYVQTF